MGEAGDTFAGVLVGAKCAHERLDANAYLATHDFPQQRVDLVLRESLVH